LETLKTELCVCLNQKLADLGWHGSSCPDTAEWQGVPQGMLNTLPQAGDFVVMSECTSHAVLPWRSQTTRYCLGLRYKCGEVLRQAGEISYGVEGEYPHWPAEVLGRDSLMPVTRMIMAGDYTALRGLAGERPSL
jgi:hypothetical protein